MKNRLLFILFLLIFLLTFTGIGNGNAGDVNKKELKQFKKGDPLIIALIPEKNVFDQKKRYRHITKYLSKELDLHVREKILPDYGKITDAFIKGATDAGFFGSFAYVFTNSKIALEPIARPVWPDGSSTYSGYIFVRKDSGIKSVKEMEGKSISLVHKATTAGYIFPLTYLTKHGVSDMETYFSRIYYTGSHDSAAYAVYIGESDVGACKNHIYNALSKKHPDFKNKMLILAESPEVPSNGLAVRKEMAPSLKRRLKSFFLNLHKSEEGREVLKRFGAERFIETTNEDYSSLNRIIEKLEIDMKDYPYKE